MQNKQVKKTNSSTRFQDSRQYTNKFSWKIMNTMTFYDIKKKTDFLRFSHLENIYLLCLMFCDTVMLMERKLLTL